jgi:hypothetical protein
MLQGTGGKWSYDACYWHLPGDELASLEYDPLSDFEWGICFCNDRYDINEGIAKVVLHGLLAISQ